MFAESVSIWASVNSWFTPTTFFVVLNLMIGTIYITSTLSHNDDAHEQARARARPQVAKSPSVLQRLRSFAAGSEEQSTTTTTIISADRHQFQNPRFGDDVTARPLEKLGYADGSGNGNSDFPQFQNPSGGDDVTVRSPIQQRLGFADRSGESPDSSSARLDSDFPQFQNPRNGDDVTAKSQNLQMLSFYANRPEGSATDLHQKSPDSSSRPDFPQFQNPRNGDDVTSKSQNLRFHADSRQKSPDSSGSRPGFDFPRFQNPRNGDDVTSKSQNLRFYADSRRKSPDSSGSRPGSDFPQFQNPRNGDDVTIESPRRLDLTARFDSSFPQFQNPRSDDDVTIPAQSSVADSQPWIEPEVARDLRPVFEEARGHVARSKSDTKPGLGDAAPRVGRRIKKSASLKSAFSHFREEEERSTVEARRPATARVAPPPEADECVDAKADDFINRFKQQLKLQRMDSITRYKRR